MQTGKTVGEWRSDMRRVVKNTFSVTRPNKYSGNVYDAVWLYALALDKLVRQNKSYVQDLHAERSIQQFVSIIGDTDFYGVTGRINFVNGHSRLSNIKVGVAGSFVIENGFFSFLKSRTAFLYAPFRNLLRQIRKLFNFGPFLKFI